MKQALRFIDHHSSTSLHCILREDDYYFNDSTMADKCISCKETVTESQHAIECDGCSKWNHRTCNTGKLNFFFHSISSSRPFSPTCSFMKYLLYYQFWQSILSSTFFIGITKQAYDKAVRAGVDLSWRCFACQPGSEVAESSTILEQSMDIQASPELNNQRSFHSDSLQSAIYDARAQSTSTVSLKPQGEIWTLFINRTTLLLSLKDTSKEISRLVELT